MVSLSLMSLSVPGDLSESGESSEFSQASLVCPVNTW